MKCRGLLVKWDSCPEVTLPQARLAAFCTAYISAGDMVNPASTITALVDYRLTKQFVHL